MSPRPPISRTSGPSPTCSVQMSRSSSAHVPAHVGPLSECRTSRRRTGCRSEGLPGARRAGEPCLDVLPEGVDAGVPARPGSPGTAGATGPPGPRRVRPGSPRRRPVPSAGRAPGSAPPASTSVGAVIRGSRSVVSWSGQRVQVALQVLRGLLVRKGEHVVDEPRRRCRPRMPAACRCPGRSPRGTRAGSVRRRPATARSATQER